MHGLSLVDSWLTIGLFDIVEVFLIKAIVVFVLIASPVFRLSSQRKIMLGLLLTLLDFSLVLQDVVHLHSSNKDQATTVSTTNNFTASPNRRVAVAPKNNSHYLTKDDPL